MKEKCDNRCETCPMPTQIHCILVFSKATNESVGALDERLKALEGMAASEQPNLINPLKESVILPTQETGGKTI